MLETIKKKEELVLDKMKTEKKSVCSGDCCATLDDGELLKEAVDAEKSVCQCIRVKVECGSECGCDPLKCRNRQMSLKQELKQGVDFEERTAWGIDLCTAINLLDILPRDIPLTLRSYFLEKRLLFAIQQQAE
jgi:hypothetical protein